MVAKCALRTWFPPRFLMALQRIVKMKHMAIVSTILVVNRCKDPSLREKRTLAGASMHVIPRPRMACFQAALKKAGIEIVRPAMVA
jgi:hypothetical protein